MSSSSSLARVFTKYGYSKVMAELKKMSHTPGTSFYAILHKNHIVGYIALFEDDIWGEIAFALSPGGFAHPSVVDDAVALHVVYINDSNDTSLMAKATLICFDDLKKDLSNLGIFYITEDLDKDNPMATIKVAFSLGGYNIEPLLIR